MDQGVKAKKGIPMSFDISHLKSDSDLEKKQEQFIKEAKENRVDIVQESKNKGKSEKDTLPKAVENKEFKGKKMILTQKEKIRKMAYLDPDINKKVIEWIFQEKMKGNRGASFQTLLTDLLNERFRK